MIGKVREAARFLTERDSKGGVLNPSDDAGNGQSVKDVLESKHPAQAEANPEAFMVCDDLPVLIDIEVTAEHIAKVARNLSGSAGLSALDSQQWIDLLLKFGVVSSDLREAVAALVNRLGNGIIPWEDTRALRARKLMFWNVFVQKL